MDIQIFGSFEIRKTEINGEQCLSAVDVCKALGYSIPRDGWYKAKNKFTDLARNTVVAKLATRFGEVDSDFLNLDGIIQLCISTPTKRGVEFREWATKILKKEIQKSPGLDFSNLSDDDTLVILEKATLLQRQLIESKRALEIEKAKVAEMTEKSTAFDIVLDSGSAISFDDLAKIIGQKSHKPCGRNRLMQWLRELKILKYNQNGFNVPYQDYIENGWFEVVEKPWEHKNKELAKEKKGVGMVTKVTQKGVQKIVNLWANQSQKGISVL